jgi:uncharacterized membrane protein affecting hemolysin expression
MSPAGTSRLVRIRAILVALFPALSICAIVVGLLAYDSHQNIGAQSQRFGNAMADQLAITATDHLINQDALSLNIMVRDLLSQGHFEFAAIHDQDSNLVAQAGKSNNLQATFTRDITFQDTVIGHLRLGLRSGTPATMQILVVGLALFLLLAVIFSAGIWFYGDLLLLWITALPAPAKAEKGLPVISMPDVDSTHIDTCWLTIKLKPDRLVDAHREKVDQACQLYGGEAEIHGDDIVVTFNTGEHIQNSICCALLVKAIVSLIPGKVSFRAGVDIGEDQETTPKHAAYLASMSEQQLLVSRRIRNKQQLRPSSSIRMAAYHHSLIGDGEVFEVSETSTNPLIQQQAVTLFEGNTP